jgi:hypothetical protein
MITEMEYQSIPSNICFNKQFGTIELDIDKGSYQANGVLSYTSNNGGWRLANSLVVLQNQINSMAPLRNKASDGTIGNESHSKTTSDHNPHIFDQESGLGIVTAMDITHDPKHDFDCNVFAESLVKNKDGRVKYIIWNNRIINSEEQVGYLAWTWRYYTGANPHRKHLHISVKNDKENYDAMSNWRLT